MPRKNSKGQRYKHNGYKSIKKDEIYICPDCVEIEIIQRTTNNTKEINHKKTLYCNYCKRNRNFINKGLVYDKRFNTYLEIQSKVRSTLKKEIKITP